MQEGIEKFNFEHFHQVFTLLGRCTEDYLFVYDLQQDLYTISEAAVERFSLSESTFYQATDRLQAVCYPDDWQMLQENIQGIIDGTVYEHNMEYRWLSSSGHPIWISCRGQIILDDNGKAKYMVGRITELGRRNIIDNVTGLYREPRLWSDLSKIAKEPEKHGYLLQVGIDNFKEINDKYGKAYGDDILLTIADCVRVCVNDEGSIYRMDGDEMLVVMEKPSASEVDPARKLYHRIRQKVDESISKSGYQHFYTISGGSVYFDGQTDIDEDFIKQAEFALHQAKIKGKNTYVKYNKEEYELFVKRLDMQERLRQAVEDNFRGFELYYQPIVNIEKHKILGAEALLRWQDEVFGRVSPAEFIPLLEESGLIIPVGRWIMKTAMKQCQKWQKEDPDFRVNINLSFIQLKKSDVIKDIDGYMDELHLSSRNILFEVTESGELEEGNMTKKILQSFQKRNLNLGIDDFGTGYSNFRYVKEMMFHLVKIDQSFIRNITQSQYDYMVVKQFTELAHSLNLQVCYEGVETVEELQCVLELHPDYIQGYYFAKPVPAQEFEENYLCKIQGF